MKKQLALLLAATALLLSACGKKAGCSCADACNCATCDCATKSSPANSSGASAPPPASSDSAQKPFPAPGKHPLKGIVTALLPDDSALMVKHEEIPGVMKAMTMMLTVDPAVLSTVKKGDAITALLYRDAEGTWRLDDVKVLPPTS